MFLFDQMMVRGPITSSLMVAKTGQAPLLGLVVFVLTLFHSMSLAITCRARFFIVFLVIATKGVIYWSITWSAFYCIMLYRCSNIMLCNRVCIMWRFIKIMVVSWKYIQYCAKFCRLVQHQIKSCEIGHVDLLLRLETL